MNLKPEQTSNYTIQKKRTGAVTSLPAPRQEKLSTLEEIRSEMLLLYRAAGQGVISNEDLKNRVYSLSQIAKLVEIQRIERRLELLEALVSTNAHTH